VGRKSVVKERFSKKYRHPALDSKLTLKRLNAVRFRKSVLFVYAEALYIKLCIVAFLECFISPIVFLSRRLGA